MTFVMLSVHEHIYYTDGPVYCVGRLAYGTGGLVYYVDCFLCIFPIYWRDTLLCTLLWNTVLM
jgi:hypothetical protein